MLPATGGKSAKKKVAPGNSNLAAEVGKWFSDTVRASKAGDKRATAPERRAAGVGRKTPKSSNPPGFDRATSAPKSSAASKASKRANLNLDQLRAKGNAARPKSPSPTVRNAPGKGADPGIAPKKTPSGGGGGGAAAPTPKPGKKPKGSTSKDSKTSSTSSQPSTLEGYLKQAQSLLGPGTDYTALKNQVTADTGTADTNIAAMYAALTRGITDRNGQIKQGYDDAEADQRQIAGEATQQVNAAYGSSAQQLTDRMAQLGIGDAAKSLAAGGANAQTDQARATSSIAQRLANTVTNTTRNGASATAFNAATANAQDVAGVSQRVGLQGQLADSLAKINTSASTEAADRRDKALSYALTQQGSDQQAKADAAAAKLAAEKQAFDESYKSGQLKLGNRKADITENHNAASDTQAALDSANKVASDQDKMKLANAQYQLSLKKLKDTNTNSLLNRKNAARTAAMNANMTAEQVENAVKAVR